MVIFYNAPWFKIPYLAYLNGDTNTLSAVCLIAAAGFLWGMMMIYLYKVGAFTTMEVHRRQTPVDIHALEVVVMGLKARVQFLEAERVPKNKEL